jgi:hypothetical protein
MKPVSLISCILLAAAVPALAQEWEFGLGAGYGFSRDADIRSAAGTARAGFTRGAVLSAYGAQNGDWLSGELRYDFKFSDSHLSGLSQSTSLNGQVHSLHFDFLFHPRQRRVQPFVILGAGIRYYRATGTPVPIQPLGTIAALMRANQVEPLIAPGVGLKLKVGGRAVVRLELRDYITPFPRKVITPYSGTDASWRLKYPPPILTLEPTGRTGSDVSGWLHDFTPMVSIGVTF